MKGRNGEDAVLQLGVEEARFSADPQALAGEETVLRLSVGTEKSDVVQHPAEFFVELLAWEFAGGEGSVGLDQAEASREFAGAKIGLMETLAGAGTTVEHVEVLALAILGGEFGSALFEAGVEDFKVGFDDVGDIAQKGGGALLAGVFDEDTDGGDALASQGGSGGCGGLGGDFVAADIGETDGLKYVKAVNDPADLRFPINGLKDATRGGGGNDVVGDPLDFHFWPGEAGEVAGDVKLDAVGHGNVRV